MAIPRKQVSNAPQLAPDQSPTRPKPRDATLPQWALNLIRPVLGFFSNVFWRVEYKGVENVPADRGVIVAANHQSYGDPVWLSIPIKRPIRYLAWSEAFSWPVVGKAISLVGAWPLQIEGSDPAAIRRSINWLRENGVVVIFPEGSRGLPDGSMVRMKGGAVRMALEAGVPILPVSIRGANRVWPTNRLLPRPGKVEITYHPLIHVEQQPGEETRVCARRETQKLADIIRSGL